MKSLSLKSRLSLLVSILLLTTIIVICGVAYTELKENLLKNIDRTLKAMAEGILVDLDKSENYRSHQAEFNSITGYDANQQFPVHYRIWTEGDQADMYASDPKVEFTADLETDKTPLIGTANFFNLKSKKQYRAIWMRRSVHGQIVNILGAHSSHSINHEMGEFLQLLLILGGSMTIGIFLLIPPIVAWGMRPVDQVATSLHQITHRSLASQQCLDGINVPAELSPFVEALQKMFVRLDAAMQQQKLFITDASHELRTPLCIIKSTLQTIRMKDRDKAEYINAIDDSLHDVERMERLVEQLLSLSRIDESEKLSNISDVSLDTLVEKLARTFNGIAMRQDRKVICEKHNPVLIQGDENELIQLFSNILDNALKYGPPKSDIRITMNSDSGDKVTVCIHDDGGDIPSDDLTRLFDRFYRADSSRSRATGGAGLGLSIAKEIAIRHDGDIEIISNPGTGTSVFVHLPQIH